MTDGTSTLTPPSHARAYFKYAFLITALSCPLQVGILMFWWENGFWWVVAMPFIVYPFSLFFFLCSNFGKPYFFRKFMAMTFGFLIGYVVTYGLFFVTIMGLTINAMD